MTDVSFPQRTFVYVHVLLIATFAWMSGRTLVAIVERVQSGHIPSDAWLIAGILTLTVGLPVLVALGTREWARTGRRQLILAADTLVLVAGSSALLPLLFADSMLVVALALALGGAILAIVVRSTG